ncbi:hypothetical protein CSOJ01_09391 [Colletotrichum sojae]|uniref:Uncharacterized protein n=1 Tax=Colletotrichum sojae TaxID=2175907 RepID=A0A8H6MQN1_9PEZI|nr:hypothetical protein CSOJ01_09391 [Colletotrichum sojae]
MEKTDDRGKWRDGQQRTETGRKQAQWTGPARRTWMASRAETGPVAELSEAVTEGEAHPSACLLEDRLGTNDEWRLSRGGDDMGANVETEGRGGQVPPEKRLHCRAEPPALREGSPRAQAPQGWLPIGSLGGLCGPKPYFGFDVVRLG